ncbi:hypothetical protein MA16_Dca016779 [Dendrobium catenatum]|uniref:Uncharacterized protein n=1 Tax=Dendrobium catenatum TaxID=906689 RepID=A0A2I0WZB7_9ASPA|nr:hypothetical protein MA16_Dca016779 [Dendrobium catenatum]
MIQNVNKAELQQFVQQPAKAVSTVQADQPKLSSSVKAARPNTSQQLNNPISTNMKRLKYYYHCLIF